jgi:hypothetical protein
VDRFDRHLSVERATRLLHHIPAEFRRGTVVVFNGTAAAAAQYEHGGGEKNAKRSEHGRPFGLKKCTV